MSPSARLARRDRVVLEHLPLVKAIAVRVHENLPVHVDLDDLVHAGILGLFDAASKYDPDKQVVFSSYAKHRIKGAILDSLRQLDWASRDMRRRHKQVEAATRDLSSTLQRAPTEAEIADKLGMDVDRWRTMMLDLRNVGLISASTRSNEDDDLPAPDFPSNPETQPDSICAREQLRSVLGVAMKTLPERYQKVVVLYYTNEMTMKEIGGVLGINESRVSQIHKSALEKMQSRCKPTASPPARRSERLRGLPAPRGRELAPPRRGSNPQHIRRQSYVRMRSVSSSISISRRTMPSQSCRTCGNHTRNGKIMRSADPRQSTDRPPVLRQKRPAFASGIPTTNSATASCKWPKRWKARSPRRNT